MWRRVVALARITSNVPVLMLMLIEQKKEQVFVELRRKTYETRRWCTMINSVSEGIIFTWLPLCDLKLKRTTFDAEGAFEFYATRYSFTVFISKAAKLYHGKL